VAYARDVGIPRDATVREIGSFIVAVTANTFDAIGQGPVVGVVLAVLLVAGFALLLTARPRSPDLRRRTAPAIGLLLGAVGFVVLTSWSRASLGVEFADQSRYFHIIAAMVLPALAIAADTIVRRRAVLVPIVAAVLLVGIPGNINITWNQVGKGRGERSDRGVYLAFAAVPAGVGAPDWLRPDPNAAAPLTLGWLRKGIADGKVPRPKSIDPEVEREATFRLSLQQISAAPSDLRDCAALTQPTDLRLEKGATVGFRMGTIRVGPTRKPGDPKPPPPLNFKAARASRLLAVRGPLELRITPHPTGGAPELCAVAPAH
jgi:hypothetical protein